jgi:type II secretory pathway pseudopilin PulG
MKRCPTCNKTYSDDSMSFCLEDGAPLLTVGAEAPPASGSFDPNLTIPFTPPRETSDPSSRGAQGSGWGAPTGGPTSGGPSGPPSGFGQQPGGSQYGQSSGGQYGQQGGQYGGPQSGQYQPTPSWTPPQQSFATPQKKSSALPWILGGIAALVVLGVVAAAIIGVLASMGSKANKNNSNNSNSSNRSNRNATTANTANSNNSNSTNANTASSGTPSVRDDFSSQKWWTGTVTVGTASYSNGEYRVSGNKDGYIVVYGPKTNDYHSENARILVTTRCVTGTSPTLGYGLAVYGEMKNNQLEDYSFLIRTDSGDPAYRIVLHQKGKETVLVDWTSSEVIRTGTSPNQLEVRTNGKTLTFYINGQQMTSVNDQANYGAGLVGFYTSDTDEVAFDDLEIYK